MRKVLSVVACCVAGAFIASATLRSQPAGPPAAAVRPVMDTYHGVSVTDPYRWLENWDDPEVRAWTDKQNVYTRSQLDALPFMPALRARVQALGADTHPTWRNVLYRHGRLFAIERQPPREQPMLVVFESLDGPSGRRVIVDPSAIDTAGTTSIDFYEPSLDGTRVAVSLSRGGTESGDVHVFDVASGKEVGEVVPRVNGGTAGGSVAWNADGTAFFYTRYPRSGERPAADLDFFQQIYRHTIDRESADPYEIGKDFPKIAESTLVSSHDGAFLLATVNNGDGGERALYVRAARGAWMRLAGYPDAVVTAKWAQDGSLYLLSRKGAPRGQILRIPRNPAPTLANAQVIVPQSDTVIVDMEPTASRLYVMDLVGGPSQVRVVDAKGSPEQKLALEPVSSVTEMVALEGDDILYRAESYVTPAAYYRNALGTPPRKTALAVSSSADFSDIEVRRVDSISRDRTHVPLNVMMRKGTRLDGQNPTLLLGYGGYDISLMPQFAATRRIWFDQGGVFVVANLRGGGEFGDEWHQAGRLTKKQNVFDDFEGAARYLIEQRYASSDTLSALGGSNGGLLMGAALTQHPELFRAIVSHVGIYDMLRFELFPNGAFNTTEFGSVTDREQFQALYAYSPYHHVVQNTRYPAVLMLSGTNDPRVNPADSRKFTARLQAATASGRPVLLRMSGSGHGFGTALSDQLAQTADQYAFLFWQLGIKVSASR